MLVEVGIDRRAGEVLADTVLHDLDAGRGEASGGAAGAQRHQVVDLLEPARAFPPQGTDDAAGERAPARGGEVRLVVPGLRRVVDDRVLPAGDAERVQERLALQQALVDGVGRQRRLMLRDEGLRALVQRALRRAVRVALDPAVFGIGRVGGDPRDLQRLGVDPGAVTVAVRQDHRSIRHDRVDVLLGGTAAWKDVLRPASAQDPGLVRMRSRVRGDRLEVRLLRVEVVLVALQHVDAAAHGVHVRILEPRDEHATGEVDHLGAVADQVADLVVGADRDDRAVAHRHGSRPRSRRIDGVHIAVDEDQVGSRAHR